MKLAKCLLLGFFSFSILAMGNSSDSNDKRDQPAVPNQPGQPSQPIKNPGQPVTPVPDPSHPNTETEMVGMNINFYSSSCYGNGSSSSCTVEVINNPSNDKKIILNEESIKCVEIDLEANYKVRQLESNDSGSSPINSPCSSRFTFKEGHWIDYDFSISGQRIIGIVTIRKYTQKADDSSDSPNETMWYEISVEVLGKNKTIVQMSTHLSSWDQLQPIRLLVDEIDRGNFSGETHLSIGPALFPISKNVNLPVKTTLPPAKWNVKLGKIIH